MRATRATALVWMLGASALGCAGGGDAGDGEMSEVGGGKADDGRDSGTVFFVHDNHRVCFAAPCPSYTVITPGAVRFDVARIELEAGAEAAVPLLAGGGALVAGQVETGSWEPGQRGPALRIAEVIEPARSYLVAQHVGGDAPYALVSADGIDDGVHRIDLDGFVAADLGVSQTLDTLVAGQWAAAGFLARSDTGEVVFFATTGAGLSMPCLVAASEIECVREPCPVWRLAAMDGEPLGHAARVDLGYLQLPEGDADILLDRLFEAGGAVYGWLAEGSWQEGAGDVLLVVRLLEATGA